MPQKVTRKFQSDQIRLCTPSPKSWEGFYIQKLRHLSVGKYYKFSDKLFLGLFSITWILTTLVVLPAMYFTPFFYVVLVILGVRWLIMMSVFYKGSRKL